MEKDKDTNIEVAKIGLVGVLLSAIIYGLFSLVPLFFTSPKTDEANTESIIENIKAVKDSEIVLDIDKNTSAKAITAADSSKIKIMQVLE
ncbi:MAG: hypothetical protein HRT47_00040 [Candidatus Caenarcaniphilales bacterium]|nr:hypothetical protein [Candidatus Caenarcaniphilales bacterium]